MKKRKVKALLKTDSDELVVDTNGLVDNKSKTVKYKDKEASVTILLADNILIRETEEAILSYKFKEDDSSFEIYVKSLRRTGNIPLKTYKVISEKNSFEVEYQLEGNDFKHFYKVEWSD